MNKPSKDLGQYHHIYTFGTSVIAYFFYIYNLFGLLGCCWTERNVCGKVSTQDMFVLSHMVSVSSHLSHRMAKIQQNIFCQITTPIYFVVFVVVETVDNFAFSAVWCSLSKDSIKSWTLKNRWNIWNIW